MGSFQLNRHHSETCGTEVGACKSVVVIVKLSIKSDLFDKAIEFIKDRIVETRAFEGCQKCEVAASKEESDIIVTRFGILSTIKKSTLNGEQRQESWKKL